MRMLALTALVTVAGSSVAVAQTDPAAPTAPAVAATHTTSVHTHTVTHHDGKRHPKVTKVVHRSTAATPNGAAVKTTTATSTTTPQ
ncbi:hypothetical protein [Sphingomonas sp.]|uniref:hypothetical protein n=1 Tax=Sphingomonas sp. TaxID=28214 RepID=UPI003AFFF0B5